VRRGGKVNDQRQNEGPVTPAPRRLPKVDVAYFFFADFFVAFLAAFFFVAIKLTTFHAVRDLTVAPTWQTAPDRSGNLNPAGGGKEATTTFNIHRVCRPVPGGHHFACRKYAINKTYCQAFVYQNRYRNAVFHDVPQKKGRGMRDQSSER